jgi:hypothetical protein
MVRCVVGKLLAGWLDVGLGIAWIDGWLDGWLDG